MHVMAAVHLLGAEGNGPPFQNPNKWLPEGYEIIFGGIASLVIFGALYKFAGPMVTKFMSDRTARIQADLDRSAAAKAAADADAGKIRADLGNADAESAEILAAARRDAEKVKADGLSRLEVELAETRAKALADIEAAKSRAQSEVAGAVSRLAMGAAEEVVDHNLDDATQQALVEKFIQQVSGMHS
jgi:F-type H+-transporting ATPase subunit b